MAKTTIYNLSSVRQLESLLKQLHFNMTTVYGRVTIEPDRGHYPEYAEGARMGSFDTVEEACAFLKGWAAHQDYLRLGKGIKD